MRHLIPASLIVAALAFAGCTRDEELKQKHEHMGHTMTTQPMSGQPMSGQTTSDKGTVMKGQTTAADACTHCPGNQVATGMGTCPACGMKVQ